MPAHVVKLASRRGAPGLLACSATGRWGARIGTVLLVVRFDVVRAAGLRCSFTVQCIVIAVRFSAMELSSRRTCASARPQSNRPV